MEISEAWLSTALSSQLWFELAQSRELDWVISRAAFYLQIFCDSYSSFSPFNNNNQKLQLKTVL